MKTTQVLKSILIGIVAAAALFFIPFPFRFFFIFFLIFFCIRFFARGRFRRHHWRDGKNNYYHFWNPSYTQRWRNMSDEERKTFIQKMEKELFATQVATV